MRGVPAAVAVAAAADNQPRTHDTWLLEPVPLPDKRKGPGLLYIGEGEAPQLHDDVEVVNLRRRHRMWRRATRCSAAICSTGEPN